LSDIHATAGLMPLLADDEIRQDFRTSRRLNRLGPLQESGCHANKVSKSDMNEVASAGYPGRIPQRYTRLRLQRPGDYWASLAISRSSPLWRGRRSCVLGHAVTLMAWIIFLGDSYRLVCDACGAAHNGPIEDLVEQEHSKMLGSYCQVCGPVVEVAGTSALGRTTQKTTHDPAWSEK
jgi:hypothetical protein